MKRVSILSAALLLSCLVMSPQALRADTVTTFQDLTEQLSVSTDLGSRITLSTCTNADEVCTMIFFGPSGASLLSPNDVPTTIYISDANGTTLSEILSVTLGSSFPGGPINQIGLKFQSVPEGFSPICTPSCQMIENGQVQNALTLHWDNGTNDAINFQSDVEPGGVTPEPASLLLLGSGLVGLIGVARRKLSLT